MLWRLAFPLTKPALADRHDLQRPDHLERISAYPSSSLRLRTKRTLPLALWTFQGQYSVNNAQRFSRRCS
jgi:raffinose/stachyose/melibiose transport system permease protein